MASAQLRKTELSILSTESSKTCFALAGASLTVAGFESECPSHLQQF